MRLTDTGGVTSSTAATSPDPVHLGFLHTSPSHVPRFDALVEELGGGIRSSWVVDEGLLEAARRGASDDELVDVLRAGMARLVGDGAQAVVCTCSTVGALAEEVGRREGIVVVRVDRPMADRAVRMSAAVPGTAVRILVVAALGSTVVPTTDLLAASAARAGTTIEVDVLRCEDTWPLFEDGRADEFADAVAAAVVAAVTSAPAPSRADVVVMAQASMAPAGDRLVGLGVPVLTSPREAVRHALRAAVPSAADDGQSALSG